MTNLLIAINAFFENPVVAGAIGAANTGNKLFSLFRFLRSKFEDDSIGKMLLDALEKSIRDACGILSLNCDKDLLRKDLKKYTISPNSITDIEGLKQVFCALMGVDIGDSEIAVFIECFDKNVAANATLFHYLCLKWMRQNPQGFMQDNIKDPGCSIIEFSIGTDGSMTEVSVTDKNRLYTWLVKKGPMAVHIRDERTILLQSRNERIQNKLDKGLMLTDEERFWFPLNHKAIQIIEHERLIKERACSMLLKDEGFLAYIGIFNEEQVTLLLKRIIDLQWREEIDRGKQSDDHILCNFSYSYTGKNIFNFCAPVTKEAIKKAFFGLEEPHLLSAAFYELIELDKDTIKEIAVFFYYKLAEWIIFSENGNEIVKDKQAMNLLNYYVGLQ